jgi:catechol 2,3-dioxygenase-like lactoylglutathione lyase family enzyme
VVWNLGCGTTGSARVRVTARREPGSAADASRFPVAFHHCVIHVSDWERSNRFYVEVLGAELIERGRGTWAYRFGSTQLNVHGPGVEAEPVARVPVTPCNSDLCFAWSAAIEHGGACGVAIELGPVSRHGARGAGTSVYFRDPDGTLLEFIACPG